ncbi:MAG: aminomethyl-transferring glycine dehydrogenase subunit GcvPB [Deltaproteobacteria bacterium]|nr:aminomethyl-transferring glycine dehydrogenase subunit GcvPB [Deltaproteobacteria bacterium]
MSRPAGVLRYGLLPEPLIFERGAPGRTGATCDPTEVGGPAPVDVLPAGLRRDDGLAGLPEVSELDVVRHFTRLSQWNLSAATTLYPLGSCTMKYNPIVNEAIVRSPGFAALHPLLPDAWTQGALELMDRLAGFLRAVSGLPGISLQPAAGAHGELTGLKMVRAYHADRGNPRHRVLIPASAHGTNPASAALCGYTVTEMPANDAGILEVETVRAHLGPDVAAMMITNPNTIGLFERNIQAIAEAVREAGALLYCDGANMNALLGVAKPGDMGADVLQFNLHKTFSTPHGGGGPGAGPVAVSERLEPYLPTPRLVRDASGLRWSEDFPKTIGRVRSFHGNVGMLVRAYGYLRTLGGDGLTDVTAMAVLNANYIRAKLADVLPLAFQTPSLHECVFTDRDLDATGAHTLDLAKRLLDYGFFAPTIYFPLVVPGAIMIEPTETESKQTLDEFIAAVRAIVAEARETPELVKEAPHATFVGRLDETRAARRPVLRWKPPTADPG